MNKLILISIFTVVLFFSAATQNCDPDSLETREVRAIITDNNIGWEFQKHQVYFNATCESNDKLLLHLVGTIDNPASTSYFPTLAANKGFKVISLKYPNNVSGTSACGSSSDIDCHLKYHQEVIFGNQVSAEVTVDATNCIFNRFEKLLIYLNDQYPSENWEQFLTNTNEINWSDILLSGHSQGGGHVTFLGRTFNVERVLTFASPNEYSSLFEAPATWISLPSATPDSNFYAFGNLFDELVDFSEQYLTWNTMNLIAFGDTVSVDNQQCPFDNSRMLYTQDTSAPGIAGNHNSVLLDNWTPLVADEPLFTPVWKYMLGICDISSSVSDIDLDAIDIDVYPNPVSSFLKIRSSELVVKYEIVNTLGAVLKSHKPQLLEFDIDMESYEGLLFLNLYLDDNKSKLVKVFVEPR